MGVSLDDRTALLVAQHEGYKCMPYLDTKKILTAGYGYNLIANPLKLPAAKIAEIKKHGIGEVEARKHLFQMLELVEHNLSGKLDWWSKLNAARQAVFLDMAYNMGVDGLLKFKNTLACAKNNDYFGAAREMLDSKWSRDVNPKNRPDGRNYTLAEMMRLGVFPKELK